MSTEPKIALDQQTIPRSDTRADDIPSDNKDISITLLTIDTSVINYLSSRIRPVVTQSGTQIPVPVIYGDPERWKSAQRDGIYRDSLGKIQLPLLMIRRTSMSRTGASSPVNKYYDRTFRAGWNRRNPYDTFAVTNGITPSQEYYTINAVPDYYAISYKCIVWTEYMEQMNSVIENISFESYEFWGEPNSYKFRTVIKRFDTSTQLPAGSDRMVRTQFDLTTYGYLLPVSQLDKNHNRTLITNRTYGIKKTVVFSEIETK
jgi:hypothetical protein